MNIVDLKDKTTLLLNSAWMPINVMTAKAVFRKLITGGLRPIDKFTHCHEAVVNHLPHEHPFFQGRHLLDVERELNENQLGIYYRDQPCLRSAHDFWPLPTIAIVTSKFFRGKRKAPRRGKLSLRALASEYGNVCQICGEKFPLSMLSVEHIFPRSKGGTNDDFNLLLTCKCCNAQKSDQYPYYDKEGVPLDEKIKRIDHFFLRIPKKELRKEWKDFMVLPI